MSLPTGWVKGSFGQICEFENGDRGKNYSGRDTFVASGIPMISAGHLNNGHIDWQQMNFIPRENYDRLGSGKVKNGDFLFCLRGSLGKFAFVPSIKDGAIASSLVIVRPSHEVPKAFVDYYFRSHLIREEIGAYANGSAQPNLSSDSLARFGLPLPPAAEQRRIVAKLDALIARIARARAELDRVPMLAKRFREEALSSCFEVTGFSSIPLGDEIQAIESGKNMRCDERPPREGENGVVKVSAVTWGRFDATKSKTLPPDFSPPGKSRINVGDLLISRANTLELVGAPAIVEEQPRDLFLSDKILRLVVPQVNKKWIMWFLRSPDGRRQIETMATGNQLSMRNISQDALKKILLPFPSETIRMKRIQILENAFARADRLEAEASRARKLLDRLESAILAKAFRGELVPQDENDEPAEKLLERIRAERAIAPKPKRGRSKAS